ncbi:filamentous hemagglutinin N-terminal domain-containing protein [Cupriavidus sp. WKF15]|uniref:beta strand repeat-containing protein n=1 Tax=Cupriavidus sp. WKF15 TaxID=3032282 RepID=UPI0023E271EE|nr:filamentous hemagglutinin N-terminal domain-containing protein [Cupriavidus sp. WKF15]WER45125.1 filamentous hemagglutinin N-terminal domain-containing protein [Cupriavidus sp. WKF15]
MNKRMRTVFRQLDHAGVAREVSRADAMLSGAGAALPAAHRLPVWKRALAGMIAVLTWLTPLSVTFEQSRVAAGTLNAGNRSWTDEAWETLQAKIALRIRFAMQAAQAAPIVDPAAPITFRPTITQTTGAGGGVPVVNITAPNAAGISLNQYQSFNIDPVGLILNNSLLGGTSLTGGQLDANANLGNRAASAIVNQVTSTGVGYASALKGPLEVFGAPATVIIANPNGITTQGTGFTNTLGVTLTTGQPQFLTGPAGTVTDFSNAKALGFNVTGGHIQIEGNAGVNGPGSGIEGTVGTIDLIGETIGVNAPLYAGSRINVVAGRQFVTPASTSATGTTYATAANGTVNTAAAISAANGGANSGYAIDATAFGAVTAGQIQVIGTAAGMGVRMDGQLAANAGDLLISANGDVSLAGTAAQQQSTLLAAGNIALSGTHIGVGGYTIIATGDISSSGTIQSGGQLSASAGRNLNVASTQATGDTALSAGANLQAGALQSGGALALSAAGGDGTGDIAVTDTTTAAGAATLTAARDIRLAGQFSAATVNAQANRDISVQGTSTVQSAADTALSAGGNVVAGGTLKSGGNLLATAGQNLAITGQSTANGNIALNVGGDTQIAGSLASGGATSVTAGGNLSIAGSLLATTDANLQAANGMDIAGVLIAQQNGTLRAGTNLTGPGSLAFGQSANLQAGNDVALTGKLLSNDLSVQAGNSVSLQDVQAGGALAVIARGGDVAFNGNAAAVGAAAVTAGRDVLVSGALAGGAGVDMAAGRNIGVGASGSIQAVSGLSLTATTGNITSSGNLTVGDKLTASAGNDISLDGATDAVGDIALSAGRDISISGAASGRGNAQLVAGNDVNVGGAAAIAGNVAINAGRDLSVGGSLVANAINGVAAGSVSVNNVQANGDLALRATGTAGGGDIHINGTVQGAGAGSLAAARDIVVNGSLQTARALNLDAGRDTAIAGTLQSNEDVSVVARTGSVSNAGTLQAGGNLAIDAAQAIVLGPNATSALGDTAFAAGGDIVLGGTLAGQGNGTLVAGGTISGAGNTAFGLAASLQSAGDTNLAGLLRGGSVQVTAAGFATLHDVQAGSAMNLSAGQDLNLTGAIVGGADVAASAAGNLNISGGIQSAGNTALTAAVGSVLNTGTIASQGTLGLQAGTDIRLDGTITSSGDVALASGRDIVINGVLNGQGSGQLLAGRDLAGTGTITFTQPAILAAGRDIAQAGLIQGQAVQLVGGNSVAVNNLESASTLSVQALGNSGGGDVQVNGSAAAAGAIQVAAVRDVAVNGKLAAGAILSVDAGRDIAVGGVVESVGDLSLLARQGSLSATGGIHGGGQLNVSTGLDLSLGASTSAVGTLVLSAGRDAVLNGTLAGGTDGTVIAGRDITGAGTQGITGAATLLAGRDLALSGSLQADNVEASGGNNAALNNVISAKALTLTANGNAGGGDAALTGTVGVPGAVLVQGSRDVAVGGALTGGTQVQLIGGRDVTVTGSVQAIGDLGLLAQTGSVSVSGSVATNQALSVSAGMDVNLGGQVAAAGTIAAQAGQDIALTGTVAVQLDGTLEAGRDIYGAGNAAFGQAATVVAGRDTALSGGLQGSTVTVTAGNRAGLGSVQAVSGPLVATANGNAGGGDVALSGAAASAGDLSLQGTRDVTVAGAINSGGVSTLAAGRNIGVAGDLNTVGDLTVTAGTGRIDLANATTQGNLTATAATALSATGLLLAGGAASVSAGSDMTIAGIAAQHTGVLNAGGNLNAGGVAFGDQATLFATGNINVTGIVATNGTLSASAGNSLAFGEVQAGGAATLVASGAAGGGDVSIAGATVSGGALQVTATRDASLNGTVLGYDVATIVSGRNLFVGDQLAANGDISLTATSGNLAVAGALTTGGNLTASAAGNLILSGGLVNGDTTLGAQGGMTLTGSLFGLGMGTLHAGSAITGGGALSFARDISIQAGSGVTLGDIQGGGQFTATAGGDATFGAATVVGKLTATSGSGSISFSGPVATGGDLDLRAAQNVTAAGGVSAMGAVNVAGTQGNVTVAGVSANGDTRLQAGQTLTLTGSSTVAGQINLAGKNVTLGGTLAGSRDITVAAQSGLDAGQSQIISTGNTTLSGSNVTVGNAVVGGALDVHAGNQLSLAGQQVLVVGNATLTAGNGLNNASNVLAGSDLTVSAGNLTNRFGASLASTGTTTITAGSFTNAGIVNGRATNVSVSGALANSGSLMGLNALNITAGTLNNQGGLIFAGDPNAQGGSVTGDLSLTLTGGNGAFYNVNGNILAQRDLGISAVNMAFDPSQGTINQGGRLNINAGSIYVSGTWNVGGQGATVNGIYGFTSAGTIDGSAPMTFSTNGTFANYGQISAGDLTVNGTLYNAGGATLHTSGNLTLNGSGTNRGTVESMGSLTINGGSYDNQLATTQAAGNVTFNLGGVLQNTGGTIAAGNNVSIQAGSVVNDQTVPTGQQTTTTWVSDPALLMSTPIGTRTVTTWVSTGGDSGSSVRNTEIRVATLGDLLSSTTAPATSGDTLTLGATWVAQGYYQNDSGGLYYGWSWAAMDPSTAGSGSQSFALPGVYQTVTTQQAGTSGVISAGNSVSILADSLSNRGGQISALNGVALNVQSLSNGAAVSTTTNQALTRVDQASLTALLNAINALGPIIDPGGSTGDPSLPANYGIDINSIAPSTSGSVAWSAPLGLIAAGGNLTVSGGNLVNEGILYAGNNVVINAASLTNQGGNQQSYSSQVGCASGVPDTACGTAGQPRGNNPTTTTFGYNQQNASIYAGHDLVIAAGQTSNTYGNLIAGHNIVIGGVGSTATSTTPADSLTNTSGNIVAGNNIQLNVAGAITNTLPPPVTVHENYGTQQQYAGCMTAGGYKESYCEGYVDQQSGSSSVISAGNTLQINAGSLTNVGSLISAGANAVINVAGPVVNSAQTLNAYWHSHWVQETGMFSSDKRHDIWACGTPEQCAALYGSAYTATGGVINPPTPVGNIAATIQAPNLSITAGGQIQNVGNVIGTEVSLTGQKLINGITTANTYTPRVNAPSQVISLTPQTMPGLNLGVPRAVGSGQLPTPVAGKASYVDGQLTPALSAGFGPQTLLDNLPATLQPGSTLFYFNPEEENLLLQQAALAQTGKASFIDGLSYDSKQNLSTTQQEKAILYQNALAYAQANGLQLGTALTQTQVNALDRPMLWYVEQTVPDPNCTATGVATCPTLTALMPQVYLPVNTSAMSAGGNISGTDITLDFGKGSGGSIVNTGSITAGGTLTVHTDSLTNQANVVDVGEIWNKVSGGYLKVTGTQVQPGGFMSAADLDLNVQSIANIGGILQQLNANGTVDQAGTQQLLANLQARLGGNFTQVTEADNLHTDFVKEGGSFGALQLVALVAAVVVTILTYGAASEAIGATLGAEGGTFATGTAATATTTATTAGLGNIALSAGIAGVAGSATSQVISTGSVNWGSAFEAGAVAAITAGLTNGITYNADTGLGFSTGQLAVGGPTSSLAALGGVQSIGNSVVQASSTAASNLPVQVLALAADATISAGVGSLIEGGSFGDALKNTLVNDMAAIGAFAIGNANEAGFFGKGLPGELAYIASHAALGCAAQGLLSGDCAAGAIGGAASTIVAPLVLGLIDPGQTPPTTGQTAAATAIAMLAGGGLASALGQNANAAALAAQNEALNNTISHYGQLRQQCANGGGSGCSLYQKVSTETSKPIGVQSGPYQIVAYTDANGTPNAYGAYNPQTGQTDYVMDGGDLQTFMRGMNSGTLDRQPGYQAQGVAGATNVVTGIFAGNSGQVVQGFNQMGNSWLGALQDPGWWLTTGTALVGGVVAKSTTEAAIATNNAGVFDTGANITPMSSANTYRSIGANGTFVTPVSSIESITGSISPTATEITISQAQATALENSLGLNPGSLGSSNVLSIVSGVSSRAPRSPLSGNNYFLGGGQGLPGGGAELVIDSIPSAGGQGIRQITVKVK